MVGELCFGNVFNLLLFDKEFWLRWLVLFFWCRKRSNSGQYSKFLNVESNRWVRHQRFTVGKSLVHITDRFLTQFSPSILFFLYTFLLQLHLFSPTNPSKISNPQCNVINIDQSIFLCIYTEINCFESQSKHNWFDKIDLAIDLNKRKKNSIKIVT